MYWLASGAHYGDKHGGYDPECNMTLEPLYVVKTKYVEKMALLINLPYLPKEQSKSCVLKQQQQQYFNCAKTRCRTITHHIQIILHAN